MRAQGSPKTPLRHFPSKHQKPNSSCTPYVRGRRRMLYMSRLDLAGDPRSLLTLSTNNEAVHRSGELSEKLVRPMTVSSLSLILTFVPLKVRLSCRALY